MSISLFSKILIKKSWMVNSIIKGNISKINAGELSNDKNNVKFIPTFSFLKNSNSLSKFNIKTRHIIIQKTKKRDFKKIVVINFI
tara:strand:+ start:98 stop:352 length:255 start_codon:yes stop_codon:yes gene_type:complete